MSEISTPQFDVPFRLGPDGQPVYVEQDSLNGVASSVETLLRTPLGLLEEEPDYGIMDPIFEEGPVDVDELQAAISQWEDRVDASLEEDPELINTLVRRVGLNVQARSGE